MTRSRLTAALLVTAVLVLGTRASAEDALDALNGLTAQKNGQVILIGETNTAGTTDIAVARLTRRGELGPQVRDGRSSGPRSRRFGRGAARRRRQEATDRDRRRHQSERHVRLRGAASQKDGSLDPKFGDGGVTVVDMGGANDAPLGIAMDRKGRILLFGFANPGGEWQWALLRLTKDGDVDTTFGDQGKVYVDLGPGIDFGYSVAVDKKGAVTVAGISDEDDFKVARFDASGDLDPAFCNGGFATIDLGARDRSFAVALGKRGTVLAAGSSNPGPERCAAVRLDRDGALDPSFAGDGKLTLDLTGQVRACAVDKKGRTYLGTNSNGFDVVRLTKTGELDEKFATAGVFTRGGQSTETARGLVLGKRNSVFVAGDSTAGGTGDFAVLQLDKKGVPVKKFNGGEVVRVDF